MNGALFTPLITVMAINNFATIENRTKKNEIEKETATCQPLAQLDGKLQHKEKANLGT